MGGKENLDFQISYCAVAVAILGSLTPSLTRYVKLSVPTNF